MSQVQIKIHDVLHDDDEYSPGKLEGLILRQYTDDRIEDIRIAPGPQNSPIYIILGSNETVSLSEAKSFARRAVDKFGDHVDGVDEDAAVRERNLLISTK